ncbi:uncharacterized protein LOC128548822 [Mercenaria mercenaria]|uniref:uncharacterized protein LOC128548822 n=1 Tax=Mercenaria mercenaria TaxID=6596 RepID=UPI00234EADBE|nr:uncharacterized protein LOC128548822 [Mercenaria mercenaria]
MLRYRYRGEKSKDLSLSISNVLETGYGLQFRKDKKVTQLMGQYLEEHFHHSRAISSGGRAEGSMLGPDSDSDVMGVIRGYLVVNNANIRNKSIVCILFDRTGCYPGYGKLTLSPDQYCQFETLSGDNNIDNGIRRIIVHSETRYISSKMFNRYVIPPDLIPGDNFKDSSFQINGPAKTNMNVDYVQAFETETWPVEAKQWRSRRRTNNWPSGKILSTLEEETSCYVVPTGNKTSSAFDLEWRLSFVEIERELMWSMNDTQFKCYVLLKIVKKYYFEDNIILKEISSYHMKNIVFWMCEELSESEWIPENLLSCVKTGLKMLELCIQHGNNANYFVPENNLFHTLTFSPNEKEGAIIMLQNICNVLLEKFLNYYNLILENLQSNSIDVPSEIHAYIDRCNMVLNYYRSVEDSSFIRNFHTKFLEFELLFPSICIAQALAQLKFIEYGTALFTTDRMVEVAVESIKTGHAMDYLTVSIYIAFVYFMYSKYDKVLKVLRPVLSKKLYKLFISNLGVPTYINLNSGAMTDKCNDANCKVKDIMHDRKNLVMHFNIEYHRKDMFPYPFKLFLYITGRRAQYSCNPLVVSYYLLYMSEFQCRSSKTNETRRLFEKTVSNSSHQRNYFLHLALLGYGYYATGDNEAAYKCYAKSLIIRPSVINVAVYLLAILLNDVYKKHVQI